MTLPILRAFFIKNIVDLSKTYDIFFDILYEDICKTRVLNVGEFLEITVHRFQFLWQ